MGSWRVPAGAADGEGFLDGNMADVRRIGDRVVRSRLAGSDASHAVLRYLEQHGYSGAPRVVDVEETHEVLRYLPGDSIPPPIDGFRDDDTLMMIAREIRSLHQALGHFRPPQGITFPVMPGAPLGGSFPCHNDLAPWNTIMRDRCFVGFIDWDLVTLATPEWDLAHAAWQFVPLSAGAASFSPVEELGVRLKLFLDEYGLPKPERSGFIGLVRQRQRCAWETVEQWGRAGLPRFDRIFEQGLHVSALDDIAWLDANAGKLQSAIVAS